MFDHPPHPDIHQRPVRCGVLTVSDTRSPETDRSGALIQQLLMDAGHQVVQYQIVRDEPALIQPQILALQPLVDAVIVNGGTGISRRDTTYEAVLPLLEKELPGFGELFRALSFQEIGSRAIASRAVAGTLQNLLIFCLPGSTPAVKLGLEQLILPELRHLTQLVQAS